MRCIGVVVKVPVNAGVVHFVEKALFAVVRYQLVESTILDVNDRPCVVVIGDRDATTPLFHTDNIVKEIPNATRIDVKDKGHCLNIEAPEEIIKAIQFMDV